MIRQGVYTVNKTYPSSVGYSFFNISSVRRERSSSDTEDSYKESEDERQDTEHDFGQRRVNNEGNK